MAYKEYYVGTTGPFLIDEADPLVDVPNQMATKQDVSDGIVVASDSVESETSFGLTPSAGASADFSRSDHTHGTPTAPSSGVAEAPVDGKIYVRRNGAWEELVIS